MKSKSLQLCNDVFQYIYLKNSTIHIIGK